MSNLSERVQKSKIITYILLEPNHFGTYGSNNRYHDIKLSYHQGSIALPNDEKSIKVLVTSCKIDDGLGICWLNNRHTVCYHCLGALYHSFQNVKMLISFYETYEAALKMKFGGKVYKIQSADGPGYLWATVKNWPKGAK